MPVPPFTQLFRPVLDIHADGQDHKRFEVVERLAEDFNLTTEDREEMLPSGTARRFDNRIAWAVSHLVAARLLTRPTKGVTRITDRGASLLNSHAGQVTMTELEQFEEYREFRGEGKKAKGAGATEEAVLSFTASSPEETLESAHADLTNALADELLEQLSSVDPTFFEQLVVDVLVAMGYGGNRRDAAERLGKTGDGGIDGVIREDALGLDAVYVQAKRWDPQGSVGRPDVQGFVGALHGVHATKGVFITTAKFTSGATQYAETVGARIVLVDGRHLARLMIDHGVGVSTRATYEVKRIDQDYFFEAGA